jgi:steroid delta-isomerase-like uncharacterized protein
VTETTGTSTERNLQLVLRFCAVLDGQQFAEVEAMLSPGFHLYFSGQQLNKEQTMALIRSVYVSFADFRHEVQETLAADDRVVVRFIDRATHTGDFEGIPASGRTIELGQISIFRVAGGQILEIREEADMMVLMQQLGAFPAPA